MCSSKTSSSLLYGNRYLYFIILTTMNCNWIGRNWTIIIIILAIRTCFINFRFLCWNPLNIICIFSIKISNYIYLGDLAIIAPIRPLKSSLLRITKSSNDFIWLCCTLNKFDKNAFPIKNNLIDNQKLTISKVLIKVLNES